MEIFQKQLSILVNSIYKGKEMLEFYKTILGVDVWRELNAKTGNLMYSFYYNGKPYEYNTEFDAARTITGLINLSKARSLQKG